MEPAAHEEPEPAAELEGQTNPPCECGGRMQPVHCGPPIVHTRDRCAPLLFDGRRELLFGDGPVRIEAPPALPLSMGGVGCCGKPREECPLRAAPVLVPGPEVDAGAKN